MTRGRVLCHKRGGRRAATVTGFKRWQLVSMHQGGGVGVAPQMAWNVIDRAIPRCTVDAGTATTPVRQVYSAESASGCSTAGKK